MKAILNAGSKISEWMDTVAVVALTFIVVLTVSDVILRYFARPIGGTFEIVGLSGSIVIGFAIPLTSWKKAHVYIDYFVERFPRGQRHAIMIITRIMVILLFLLAGWNLLAVGKEYFMSGEVSLTIKLPIYPFVYSVALCCFVECFVIFCDAIKILGGCRE